MQKMGRRPGQSTSRAEIVAAAATAFSTRGYEGTSMRQVAIDAGVDPALVRRFFGSKEQLFSAVVDAVFQPERAVARLLEGPRDQVGRRLATYLLELIGDVNRPGPALGLVRSAATNEHAAVLMRQFLTTAMLGRVTERLGVSQPQLRAALTAGQVVGVAITRYAVRVEALVDARPDELVDWVAPTLQRYLTGKAPQSSTRKGRSDG